MKGQPPFVHTLVVSGRRPVSVAERLTPHVAAWANARVKEAAPARRARASMCGVETFGLRREMSFQPKLRHVTARCMCGLEMGGDVSRR